MSHEERYFSTLDHQGDTRNILVFLDGTWNDETGHKDDGVTTNIYRLFKSIQGNLDSSDIPHTKTHNDQVALYFRGVGNDEDNGVFGTYYQGIFGAGEKRIRDNAYTEIVKHYRSGDRIFIFGFSRGAACARLLAAKLNKHGVKESLTVEYDIRDNERYFLRYSNESKEAAPVDVTFLGIFDTVGAFGIPINLPGLPFQKLNLFKNLDVAENVRQVVHCVAIDETREPFIPTLCNYAPHVEEVWFAGVHADIGGGYEHAELGKITLKHLVKRLNEATTQHPIHFEASELLLHTELDQDANVHMHHHGDGIKKQPRQLLVLENGEPSSRKPNIHSSVFDLMESDRMYLVDEHTSYNLITKIQYKPNLK